MFWFWPNMQGILWQSNSGQSSSGQIVTLRFMIWSELLSPSQNVLSWLHVPIKYTMVQKMYKKPIPSWTWKGIVPVCNPLFRSVRQYSEPAVAAHGILPVWQQGQPAMVYRKGSWIRGKYISRYSFYRECIPIIRGKFTSQVFMDCCYLGYRVKD